MDAPTVIEASLTTAEWLTILGASLTLAGALGLIIWNLVMKRFDAGDKRFDSIDSGLEAQRERQERQGRNIARICTALGVQEET